MDGICSQRDHLLREGLAAVVERAGPVAGWTDTSTDKWSLATARHRRRRRGTAQPLANMR
jgi:hypothetical protein